MLHDQDLLSIQEVRSKVEKAYEAWKKYRTYTQQQVDAIVEAMAEAGRANALRLAEMAVQETGYGNAKDKLAKNLLCADLLPRTMRGMKTVGLLREIPDQKIVEYGVPMGVVAAILPTTNPTSTAIYKTLISLKAGNAVVLSPHPRAKACTCATTDVLAQAAVRAGAPEDLIGCVTNPTLEATQALMKHERTAVILSTGGSGIVRAAYSSGKPAFGVGPGNVPVLIDTSADVPDAVAKVVSGKSFDFGTVCSSEQTVVAEQSLREPILAKLRECKAYLCNQQQADALAKLLLTPNWTVNPKCVGQAPATIAKMAGFEVPADTSILVAEIFGVGKQHPLSAEKLSPVLSVLFAPDFNAAMEACVGILRFGGLGHTCVIYATDDARIRRFAERMPANRVLVNTPAPQGSVGITTNVFPSMTLGCGAAAGNVTSDNVGPQHLINVKRLAYAVRRPEEALQIPEVTTATQAAAPASKPFVASAPAVEKQAVAAAVERYLAQRGISTAAPASSPAAAPAPAPAAPPSPVSAVIANPTASVVDRFLASKRAAGPPQAASCPAATCGCPVRNPGSECGQTAQAEPAPATPEPVIQIVDFVCESDVRAAIQQSRKIYIGPKTIVTPAARELAGAHDTLVMAQR